MSAATLGNHKLGWIGTGRMGFAMAARVAKAGGAVAAYNRTRAKAEPLTEYGATIVNSFVTGVPSVIYGNVPNASLITNLPDDTCVEVPCLVDNNGVQPTSIGDLPPQLAAVNRTNIGVQTLAVRAALTGDRDNVYHAVALDPLTAALLTLDEIHAMTDELLLAHADLLPDALRLPTQAADRAETAA